MLVFIAEVVGLFGCAFLGLYIWDRILEYMFPE